MAENLPKLSKTYLPVLSGAGPMAHIMINRKGTESEGRTVTFFPLYSIYSDLVRVALGLSDTRSIMRFFREAGIKVHVIGKRKCVTCEDLLNVVKNNKPVAFRYEARSDLSKQIDDLDETPLPSR